MTAAPLVIISGPSGIGKSTVIRHLLEDCQYPLRLAISATTRPPRKGEEEGKHYYFWNPEQFKQGIEKNEFLEWAIVHGIHYYGTLVSEVVPHLQSGTGVVLEIDVQGAEQIRKKMPGVFSIFLSAPLEVYEARLKARGTETPEAIERRLKTAQAEIPRMAEYNLTLVNDNLVETVERMRLEVERRFTDHA